MKSRLLGLSVALVLALPPSVARTAEMGFSVYPLGSAAFGAGATPPPGWYITPAVAYYAGRASGNLPFGGQLVLNLDVKFFAPALNILYVPEIEILGGRPGISVNVPTGYVDFTAQALLGPLGATRNTHGFGMGDMTVRTQLGWTLGHFSHLVYAMGVVPTGRYQTGFSPIIGLNRPAVDFGWAFTWLETNTNLEFSGSVGFTFNAENNLTNYKTGNEFHAEWAIGKKLTPALTIGAVGYFYEQITGDSGPGAVLGPFKGQVMAVGPGVSYVTQIGETLVIFNARHYQEFNVRRRFDGSMSYLTATVRF